MFESDSILMLAALAGVLFSGAALLPLHWLLFADLLLFPIVPHAAIIGWEIGPIRVALTDLVVAALAVGVLGRARGTGGGKVPHLWIWVAMGIGMSVSFAAAPVNQEFFTAVTAPYLLVRYVWIGILAYPLAARFLDDPKISGQVVWVLVASGLFFALSALPDIAAGATAEGPFTSGNALGPVLIPGTLAAAALLFTRERRLSWWLALFGFLALFRTQMFCHSEGALAGLLGGLTIVGMGYASRSDMRYAVQKVAFVAVLVVVTALIAKPNVLERPNVREMLQLSQGSEHGNMQWRTHERWPYFIDKTLKRPWLGWGEDTDERFGDRGVTPHNSYIGLAVKYGIPVLVAHVVLFLLGVRNGYRLFRESESEPLARLGLVTVASVAALMVHGIVDGTLGMAYVRTTMLLLCGTVSALAWAPRPAPQPAVELPASASVVSGGRA